MSCDAKLVNYGEVQSLYRGKQCRKEVQFRISAEHMAGLLERVTLKVFRAQRKATNLLPQSAVVGNISSEFLKGFVEPNVLLAIKLTVQ